MAKQPFEITSLKHDATRRNIPTAELETVMRAEDKSPIRLAYERRNRDLDPQLVWRGKDEQDWSDLIVQAPPLYIQEKVHPQALIEDIKRRSKAKPAAEAMPDLFADFNGLKEAEAATEFYQHDQHWSNRMILGDSLSVMASLAEREGLRGQVQCVYVDPPYGIKFNSNFQWSTTSRDVKDGDRSHVTREPEQVRAFRDTWRDGIHSYLTYLRDRLTVARDLLHESGSIFVQIGEGNVHRVRMLLDEVFSESNFVSQIAYQTTPYATSDYLAPVYDCILWYAKDIRILKYRPLFKEKSDLSSFDRFSTLVSPDRGFTRPRTREESESGVLPEGWTLFQPVSLVSPGASNGEQRFIYNSSTYQPPINSHWKVTLEGLVRAGKAGRLHQTAGGLRFRSLIDDFPISVTHNIWTDTSGGISSRTDEKRYIVQTSPTVVQRCLLMATDPGDLVLDPTCGSGTTAYVAEQWGRRWITIDTSRVSLALARSRLMGARYPYYLLADSPEGQRKEAEVTRTAPRTAPTAGRLRLGFVYERAPHIMLSTIARNVEIDVIWEQAQTVLEPLRTTLNAALGKAWEEWQIPREAGEPWPAEATKTWEELRRVQDKPAEAAVLLQKLNKQLGRSYTLATLPEAPLDPWPAEPTRLHAEWWKARIARQKEIDASIAAKADVEYLYDKPYEDRSRIRVAGPFTVESLSPHRALAVDWNDELIDPQRRGMAEGQAGLKRDFAAMIIENLRSAGVQQADKEDHIRFTSLVGWPGTLICAEGRYMEGEQERRAGILIGPEFGTLTRPDLVAAAREAADAGFDALIACAFAYDAHSSEFDRLGRVRVLRARMNPDLHMAQDLKATSKGNLFVIFGEPDIKIEPQKDGQLRVRIEGVDVFKPQTGEVESEGTDKIALWMIDTDYNEESFFVRHAYFLGANDPYKALKTTLKAEVDEAAWSSLNSDVSYPFPKPAKGRIAVKVINHLGDEVMKVFAVA